MLIFEQGFRWDRWTDFNAQYLSMCLRGQCIPLMVKTIISQFYGSKSAVLLKIIPN